MNDTQIKTLIDGLKSSAENPDLVLTETDGILSDIKDLMTYLAADCYDYIKKYDEYEYLHTQDASVLKEKLKDNIIKVINDEIQ